MEELDLARADAARLEGERDDAVARLAGATGLLETARVALTDRKQRTGSEVERAHGVLRDRPSFAGVGPGSSAWAAVAALAAEARVRRTVVRRTMGRRSLQE